MNDWFKRVLRLIADNAKPIEIMGMIKWSNGEWWTHPDMKVIENTFANDPEYAYFYARDIIKGRWPDGEPAIASESHWAYSYARMVIDGEWPEGESAIAKDACWANEYARNVLRSRFELGEPVIATDPGWAYYYAKNVIKGRFELGEPTILSSAYASPYRELFLNRLDEIIRVTSYGKDRKPVKQTDDLINLIARKTHRDYVFTLSDDVNRGSLRALATRGMETVGVVNMIQYSSKSGQAVSQVTNVRVNKECKGVGLALYKFCLDSGLVLGCAPVQSTGGVYLWTKIATDPAYLVYAIDEKTGERYDVDVLDGELTSDVDLYDSRIHILLYAERA